MRMRSASKFSKGLSEALRGGADMKRHTLFTLLSQMNMGKVLELHPVCQNVINSDH